MLTLIVLNFVLFIGCFAAGLIPLAFNFTQSKLRLTTVFGAGLLLGAALTVIIPEGVEVLHTTNYDVSLRGIAAANNKLPPSVMEPHQRVRRDLAEPEGSQLIPSEQDSSSLHSVVSQHGGSKASVHQQVGLALLLGFLFMFLVDHLDNLIPRSVASGFTHLCQRCSPACMKLANKLSFASVSTTAMGTGTGRSNADGSSDHRANTATLGLVIHSFADGLALGAAFALNQLQLEMLLFFAILLHKAPAAFGLACYLLHDGLSRARVRLHLLAFAIASPMAALITYCYLVSSSPHGNASGMDDGTGSAETRQQTGFALLLSGGTFLYVAASHVLPELSSVRSSPCNETSSQGVDDDTSNNGYTLIKMPPHEPIILYPSATTSTSTASPSRDTGDCTANEVLKSQWNALEVVLYILGSFIPLSLSYGHSH